jgi:hypothetical protein
MRLRRRDSYVAPFRLVDISGATLALLGSSVALKAVSVTIHTLTSISLSQSSPVLRVFLTEQAIQ